MSTTEALSANEIERYWGHFSLSMDSAYEIIDRATKAAAEQTHCRRTLEIARDWLGATTNTLSEDRASEATVAEARGDLASIIALLFGGIKLADGPDAATVQALLVKANDQLTILLGELDTVEAKGYLAKPAREERDPAQAEKPKEFLSGRTEDDVQQALTEIVTVCESGCSYIDKAAQAGEVDLAVVRSMLKQVGSLADDLGMTHYGVGSPVDWVIQFAPEKAGAE
ncbi:hypothetical protein RD110_07880 [Rhodoferax koreense]|uniref:Uncharacterized protein n=1 Tax=Rhodoferax koreensis TaxID=1842727 RepID=A0A1P8JTQ0_9BURK|nr:hypothetical protein [Rhodoferax koreense]APW37122.1 hypothetical protein RD110_07880 [Rhodoferax koreense]